MVVVFKLRGIHMLKKFVLTVVFMIALFNFNTNNMDKLSAFAPQDNISTVNTNAALAKTPPKNPNIPLYVYKKDDLVRVAFNYSKDKDMWIDFKKSGPNSLPQIYRFWKVTNFSPGVSNDLKNYHLKARVFFESYSDFVGPFTVRSLEEKSSEGIAPFFTGGYHTYDKQGRTYRTAKNIGFTVKSGENKISDNTITPAEEVEIKVINVIQGYNTVGAFSDGRSVLREEVTYRITGNKIYVHNKVTPLEDAEISRYYGLQTIDEPWNEEIKYFSGNEAINSTSLGGTSSGWKKVAPLVNKYQIRKGSDVAVVEIDNNFGLGKREYVEYNKPLAFRASYGKSYFNLINGRNLVLKKGQSVEFRGSYAFSSLDR
jgi:hypothetical protein